MIRIREANTRGHANHGWLNSSHTFSFGSYYNKNYMGFSKLRVINEDRVQANNGFPQHPHDNMEIISFVLEGELEHKDSMGTGSTIRPGEFQLMSAGSGVTHSEFNPSKENPTHFYQIWIMPAEKDIEPSYQQKGFDTAEVEGKLRIVVSPDGENDSLRINQDAKLYWGKLKPGDEISLPLNGDRKGYLQVIKGDLSLGENTISTSDGASFEEEVEPVLTAKGEAEVLFFDLP